MNRSADVCMARLAGRRAAVIAIAMLALSGCMPDTFVYFENNTDQVLYVRARRLPPSGKSMSHTLPARERTSVSLVPRDECTDRWLIYDEDGRVVKDPGTMCWHDTVAIP